MAMPAGWGVTHIGHATDRRSYDLHSIHCYFVDHLLFQIPLIKAFPAVGLEDRTRAILQAGTPQGLKGGLPPPQGTPCPDSGS